MNLVQGMARSELQHQLSVVRTNESSVRLHQALRISQKRNWHVIVKSTFSVHYFCSYDNGVEGKCVFVVAINYSHAPHNDVSVNDGPHI